MRTSIDILNYFKRSAIRKKLRQQKREIYNLHVQIQDLKCEFERQKDWHILYSELIERLQNVPKYCALKEPKKMRAAYPLERFATYEMNLSLPSQNPVLQQSHTENLYYAEALIFDHLVGDLIHFELDTSEGRFCYQYSKKGLAIQPFKMILKEVTYMLTRAWYDTLHRGK